jgi:hypothetical protein
MNKSLKTLMSIVAAMGLFGTFGATLASCDFQQGTPVQSSDRNIVSISVDESTAPKVIYIGEFDQSGLALLVTYSDGTSESIPVTTSFIPSAHRHYLETPGNWNVTIYYRGAVTTVNLNIQYRYYTVDFYALVNSSTPEKISTQSVKKGEAAVVPETYAISLPYEHTLYTFNGWDKEFANVTSDLTINATYGEETICWVSFFDGNKKLIKKNYVKEGADAVAPSETERAMTGYDFVGWDRAFTNVKADLDVYGIYTKVEVPTDPTTLTVWDGSVATSFESGTGTESNPYLIKTPQQLAYLQSLSKTDSFSGKYIVQTANLDLNNLQWTPLCFDSATLANSGDFAGHYDGHGHIVKNMKIEGVSTKGGLGLFATSSGYISNLGIEDYSISGTALAWGTTVGGLIGRINGGSVTDCYTKNGKVVFNCKSSTEASDIGGLIGKSSGTAAVTRCLSLQNSITLDYGSSAGILGIAQSDITLSNCIVAGLTIQAGNAHNINLAVGGSEGGVSAHLSSVNIAPDCTTNVSGSSSGTAGISSTYAELNASTLYSSFPSIWNLANLDYSNHVYPKLIAY